MNMKKKLFISCEEAMHICDKMQYEEVSGWEKRAYKFRLFWCILTKRYHRKNKKLSKLLQQSEVQCMSANKKEELKEKLQKEAS